MEKTSSSKERNQAESSSPLGIRDSGELVQDWLSMNITQIGGSSRGSDSSRKEIATRDCRQKGFSARQRPSRSRGVIPREQRRERWGSSESLGVHRHTHRDAAVVVPKLVDDKEYWQHLRTQKGTSQGLQFQRFREHSVRPEKIFFQLDLHISGNRRARKLASGKKKRRPQLSRLGKRKRQLSFLQNFLPSWNATEGVTLDKYLLLDRGGVEEPKALRYVRLANLGINSVDAPELESFSALHYLDLSENYVPMELLTSFSTLRKLSLQCNRISDLALLEGSFALLEVLDISYNFIDPWAMASLSRLPSLHKLNIDYNNVGAIPEEIIGVDAFPCLERLYAAANGLSSPSLLALSKLAKLERLHLRKNQIKCIPEQVGDNDHRFPALKVLDLVSNPIQEPSSLVPLRRMDNLRKVMLWDTPMAARVTYDVNGLCLPISVPILYAAIQGQRAGQHWMLQKPDLMKTRPVQAEEILSHVVPKHKVFQPVMFPDDKMLEVIKRVCQQAEGLVTLSPHLNLPENLLGGSSSMTMPFAEGMEDYVALSEQPGQLCVASLPNLPVFSPLLMEEELERITNTKSPEDPYPKDVNAAVTSLKLALQMIPFREVSQEISPPSYRMPTKLEKMRMHQTRLSLQAPITSRKRALYMAHKFADRAEREARAQVRNVLEELGHQLEGMETRIKDINFLHINAPEPKLDTLTDDEAEP